MKPEKLQEQLRQALQTLENEPFEWRPGEPVSGQDMDFLNRYSELLRELRQLDKDELERLVKYIIVEPGQQQAESDEPFQLAMFEPQQLHVPSLPEEIISPNNALVQELIGQVTMEELANRGEFPLYVGRDKKKGKIENRCIITYQGDDVKLKGKRPFTEYDREVHDAVVSLYCNGIDTFTPEMLYRVMTGDASAHPEQKQIAAISDSLFKMRFINVDIDLENELLYRKIVRPDEVSITQMQFAENLLTLKTVSLEFENAHGKYRQRGYKVLGTPILYAYSRTTRQVLNIPSSCLQIKDEQGNILRNNEDRIQIKGYLLRRVAVMKGPTTQSNRILFEKIYGLFEAPSYDKKRKCRKYVYDVLASWTMDGYIAGYKKITKNGQDYAVEILLRG